MRLIKLNAVWLFVSGMVGGGMSFLSHADDVQLNFTGTIRAAACNVASADQTVVLGNAGTTIFNSVGDMSPAKPFSISLDCPNFGPGIATVTFSGAASSEDTTLLALDAGSGTASGVAVLLADSGGTKINLGEASRQATLTAGTNTLNFTARYRSLVERSSIRAGTANATAQFTINYP
ncbi:hypothetical protein BSF37_22060 [Serratia marcescens]|uniref:fimbrial protein n=1 Tax=Serratia marcescens TaxID=615 RepID=UPI00147BD590|nr:fimbrial protein [Serratia marcescens]NMM74484.1 hypothetical protein [Serratia marcescens]